MFKPNQNLFFLVFICFISLPSHAITIKSESIKPVLIKQENILDEDKSNAQLKNKINKILAEFGENVNIGILVENVKTGKELYKKNADRYFIPASNQKLLTAFAALNYLNPNFTYQTRLFVDTTKIQNGILNDNIYLQFTGDPTLTLTQLDGLIASLTQVGVKQINGKIIVDDSAFDRSNMSPGTTWDDQKFCFGSPISALIIDHNCINATLVPAANKDLPATLQLPNRPQFIRLVNHVMTRSQAAACNLELQATNDGTYEVSGCMKPQEPSKHLDMAITNPNRYTQAALLYLLDKNHIANSGKVEFQAINYAPKLLASAASKPLPDLISTMLKDSDNTIANSLFKTMGSFYTKEKGTWQNGRDALHDVILKTTQIDIAKSAMADGAGGSRYNYLTPQQIITLLRKVYVSPQASVFIAALPVSGVDGTLKTRMTDPTTLGKIHAKTGSETAVTSLSGYVMTRKNHVLVFSIMMNGFVDLPAKYKALEDEICAALVDIG